MTSAISTLRVTAGAALGVAVAGYAGAADASVVWHFQYTDGNPSSADITLTTDDLSGGTYLITDISGSVDGHAITGLLAVNYYNSNDNLLNQAAPWLDGNGVSFSVDMLGTGNISYLGGGDGYYLNLGAEGGTFDLVAAPEPVSAGLLASGLGLLVWARRRAVAAIG